jgi:urea carboxylase
MSAIPVLSEVTGTVWEVLKRPGDAVEVDDALMIIESMKMEIPIVAPVAGRVLELRADKGDAVQEGQAVALLEPSA